MGIGRAGIGGLGIGGLGIGGLGIPSPSSDPAFIIEVDTTKAGSASDTMIIPLFSSESYDFEIDWGDTNVETYTSSALTNVTHVYSTGGVFTIKITGTFPRIRFNNTGDKLKLLDISNWGDIAWGSCFSAFDGCLNLTGTATDSAKVSNTTNFSNMFRGCLLLTPDLSAWDVSSGTNFNNMFRDCSDFTSDLSSWIVSNGTNFSAMFRDCPSFDSNLSAWDISNATNLATMLNASGFSTANYDLLLNAWSLLSVTSGVAFGASSTSYTIATSQAARDILTGGANLWTITDNGGI